MPVFLPGGGGLRFHMLGEEVSKTCGPMEGHAQGEVRSETSLNVLGQRELCSSGHRRGNEEAKRGGVATFKEGGRSTQPAEQSGVKHTHTRRVLTLWTKNMGRR